MIPKRKYLTKNENSMNEEIKVSVNDGNIAVNINIQPKANIVINVNVDLKVSINKIQSILNNSNNKVGVNKIQNYKLNQKLKRNMILIKSKASKIYQLIRRI